MSHNLENNKIMASILVAGIVAMLCGFVAHQVVHPHAPEKTVLDIDTSALETATAGGAPAGPEPVLALLADADVAKGEALSKACLACHSFEKGGANKIGPNLWGIVNNHKAHMAGFAYSDVIKDMAAKGEKWTYQNLNGFLFKPAAYAKGTKMSYPGLKKPADRAAVIGYLRTLADSQAALPAKAEIDAEAVKEEAADAATKENVAGAADKASDAKVKTEEEKSDISSTQKNNPATQGVDSKIGAEKASEVQKHVPEKDVPATPAALDKK